MNIQSFSDIVAFVDTWKQLTLMIPPRRISLY